MNAKEDVCLNCGGSGFKEAFVFCNKCQNYVVHRYCVPKFTFTGDVLWYCDACEPRISCDNPEARISASSSLKGTVGEASKSIQLRQTPPTKLRSQKRRTSRYSLEKSKGLRCKTSCSPRLELQSFDNEDHDQEIGRRNRMEDVDAAKAAESLGSENPGLVEYNLKVQGLESCENGWNFRRQTSVAESLVVERVVANAEPWGRNILNGKKQNKLTKVLNVDNAPEDTESCRSKGWEMVVYDAETCVREDKQEPKSARDNRLDRICSVEAAESHETEGRVPISPIIVDQSAYFRSLPIKDPIWRGRLSISGKDPSTSVGLVAHLSSLACPRARKAAKSLPKLIFPELFPILAVWPKSFNKGGPGDDSIALYFFPDSERNERVFDSLVNDMMCEDWAMKAVTETAELLMFTSRVLPFEYWRFRTKFYLWGLFKGKKTSASTTNGYHT